MHLDTRNKAHADDVASKAQHALRLNHGVAGNITTTTTGPTGPTIYEKLLEGALREIPRAEPSGDSNGGSSRSPASNVRGKPPAGRGGSAATAGADGVGRADEDDGRQLRRHKELLQWQTRRLEQQELEQMRRQREKRERKVEELVRVMGEISSHTSGSGSGSDDSTDSINISLVDPRACDRAESTEGFEVEEEEEEDDEKRGTAGGGRGEASPPLQSGVEPVDAAPAVVSPSSCVFSSDEDDVETSGGGGGGGGVRGTTAARSNKESAETLLGRWSDISSGASGRFSEVRSALRVLSCLRARCECILEP